MTIEKETSAYFTLVNNDPWVISALVLGCSLRMTGTESVLVCQCGPQVSQRSLRRLEEVYDIVEPAEPFAFPDSKYNNSSDIPPDLEFSFRRLHAWKREEFKRITYLDPDMVVFQPIDDLFSVPGVAAARDLNFRIFRHGKTYTDYFNGGLVTFSPSLDVFTSFRDTLRGRWVYLGAAEQHLVNLVCREEWFRIPDAYHVQAGASSHAWYAGRPEKIKTLHFARISKPWDAHYNGRKHLYRSWRLFARMWVQVMRECSKNYDWEDVPDALGWESHKVDNRPVSLVRQSIRSSESPMPIDVSRMMKPRKLAEIAVFKGAIQKISELSSLAALLRRRKLRTVVEIGTARGGTLWLWCQLAESDAHIVSIDIPGRDGLPSARDEHLRRHAIGSQKLDALRMDSQDQKTVANVRELLSGTEVDFLFIDADHSYAGVRRDFELYVPLVRSGGLVVFHDILPHPKFPSYQVHRFWSEICESFRHREFLDHKDERGWGQWGGIGVLHV